MVDKIKENLENIVNNENVFIDNVEYVNEKNMNILRVTIDSNTSIVDLNLCVDVTKLINEYLDKNDFIQDDYMLEVSSKGVEDGDLEEELSIYDMIDQNIHFKTYAKINGKKEFVGRLKEIREDEIDVVINDEIMTIKFEKIAIVKECPSTEEE